MPHELAKAYDPGAIEARWAEYWERERLFHVKTPAPGEPIPPIFTILLPPPNVTGRLHMGHMLEHAETDIYVRWKRMCGYLALWLPGTGMAEGVMSQMAKEAGKVNGKDYAFLGWSPGGSAVIINMGQDLYKAFPSDYYNQPTKDLAVLGGVKNLRDVSYALVQDLSVRETGDPLSLLDDLAAARPEQAAHLG